MNYGCRRRRYCLYIIHHLLTGVNENFNSDRFEFIIL
jgi:hypothetical protein